MCCDAMNQWPEFFDGSYSSGAFLCDSPVQIEQYIERAERVKQVLKEKRGSLRDGKKDSQTALGVSRVAFTWTHFLVT